MEMIEKTVFAASNEESRYHLNGLFFLQTKQGGKDDVENGCYGRPPTLSDSS